MIAHAAYVRAAMVKRVQGLKVFLAAAGALAVLFSDMPALAADMDAKAKALAQLDEDWSGGEFGAMVANGFVVA